GQLPIDLFHAPRQRAVFFHEVPAVPFHGVVVVARQPAEGEGTIRVQVQEVAWWLLFPAGGAPKIRIDGVLHDGDLELFEERTNLGRQEWYRPGQDVFVSLETPGRGRHRREKTGCGNDDSDPPSAVA